MQTPPPRFTPTPRPAVEDLEARALASFHESDDDIFGDGPAKSGKAGPKPGARAKRKLAPHEKPRDYASAERQAAIMTGHASVADEDEERGVYTTQEAAMLAAMERPARFGVEVGARVAVAGALMDALGLAIMASSSANGEATLALGFGSWFGFLLAAAAKMAATAGLVAGALWLVEKKRLATGDLLMVAGLLSWTPWIAFWLQWPAWTAGFAWIFATIWFVSSSFALCKALPLAIGNDRLVGALAATHLALAWLAKANIGSLLGSLAATVGAPVVG